MPHLAIIGQYWPEDSLVHAMDPRVKFILSFVLMAAVFCAATPLSLAVAALFIVGFYAASRIPLLQAIRAIGPLLVLVVLTALLNVLFVQGGHVYFEFGIICISEKGLQSAVFIGCRLLLLLMGMSLLTLTTTTLDITAAFERLMAPLSRIGVPAHELGMILGIALRFLPQFMTELGIIYRAQKSRGAHFDANPFRGGIQSIDRGQYEGAKVLGMTYVQTMRRIILPQVIKRVLPPVSNETINLLKDTSLVYILAMNDILRITRSIVQRDFDTTAFLVAAVFYLFFTFILTKVFGYLEKRYAVYDE